jgi:hypothetical protein
MGGGTQVLVNPCSSARLRRSRWAVASVVVENGRGPRYGAKYTSSGLERLSKRERDMQARPSIRLKLSLCVGVLFLSLWPSAASAGYATVGGLIEDCQQVYVVPVKRDTIAWSRCVAFVGAVVKAHGGVAAQKLKEAFQATYDLPLLDRAKLILNYGGLRLCEETADVARTLVDKAAVGPSWAELDPRVEAYVGNLIDSQTAAIDQVPAPGQWSWCDDGVYGNNVLENQFIDVLRDCNSATTYWRGCRSTVDAFYKDILRQVTEHLFQLGKWSDGKEITEIQWAKIMKAGGFKFCLNGTSKVHIGDFAGVMKEFASGMSLLKKIQLSAREGIKESMDYAVENLSLQYSWCASDIQ